MVFALCEQVVDKELVVMDAVDLHPKREGTEIGKTTKVGDDNGYEVRVLDMGLKAAMDARAAELRDVADRVPNLKVT